MEKLYNAKRKIYPDGRYQLIVASTQIYKEGDIEKIDIEDTSRYIDGYYVNYIDEDDIDITVKPKKEHTDKEKEKLKASALKRAHDKIFDLIYCNTDFQYFLTITIDKNIIDRYNTKEVMKKLNKWLQNKVQRKGLKYLLIPEHHKDGAIHAHALINDVLDLKDSKTILLPEKEKPIKIETAKKEKLDLKNARTVYNVPEWKYGFSTAIKVNCDGCQLAFYLKKYLTKQNEIIFGNYYWSSRNIVREPIIQYENIDYTEMDYKEYEVPMTGIKIKYENTFGIKKYGIDGGI